MTLSILLIINAALALFRGIGFIFAPAKLWATFKVTLDNTTTFPVRILGAAYLATVLMNWAATNSPDIASIQGVVIFNFTMEFLSAIITVYGILRNSVSKLAWIPFTVHLLVSIGFGYHLFMPQ